MANQEYVPFTGKLDAATEFEPFNGTLDGQEPSLTARVKQGVGRAVDSAQAALTDSPSTIAHIAAQQARNALPQTEKQQRMAQEMAPYVDAANKSEGVVDTVKTWGAAGFKRAGQLMSNPGEAGKMIAEQLPNSLPGLAGGFAGAKLGAMAGTAVAPGVGTVVGGILGGVAGGFAGGYGLEKGSAMLDQVQKEAQARQINLQDESSVAKMVAEKQPEFEAAAQRKGVGTAGTDAVLNVATMGLAGMGGRTLAKEAHALSASVKAGTISATDAATELARLQAANAARNTLGAKALRHSGVAGAEMAGEGFTEGVGQKYAYGSVDAGDVIDESLLGLGTGTAMAMSGKAFNKAAGIVDQDATTRSLAATQEGLRGLVGGNTPPPAGTDGWTTSPGVDQAPGPSVPPPEAPDFTTSPGAAPERTGGMDYQRDIPTDGLSLVDAAAQDRARAATVDFGQADTTAGWDTSLGAAPPRVDGIDMGREFDTSGLELDNRLPSERMGINPNAGTLSRAATIAVDSTPIQEAQFIGRTDRDLQAYQPKTGIENDNVIDVQGRVVEDRAISTPRRIGQDGPVNRILAAKMARDAGPGHEVVAVDGGYAVQKTEPNQPLLPAPLPQSAINNGAANVQDAAPAAGTQAQAAPAQAPEAARGDEPAQTAPVPAAGTGAVEAAGLSDQLEDALFKERDATTSAIENDWMNGNGRRRLTNIERAVYDATTASTLDADSAAQIIETALENDRPDLAQYAASRVMRAAESMGTTPGVPQSSPKYGKIKSDLEASKKHALDAASALQEIVNSKQAPQAADVKAITAKQIPAMTDVELQQAIEHYGPEHKRTAKLQKEVQRRAAEAPTPTTGAFDGPQADQAQQAAPQRQEAPAQPAPAVVARHPAWRKNAIQAGRVAKSLGIDPTGKRLAQMVEEIDAADSGRNQAPAPATPAQPATENVAPAPGSTPPSAKSYLAQVDEARKQSEETAKIAPKEIIEPGKDVLVGTNSAGEKLHERKDGTRYAMRNGRPNFGGDLVAAEAARKKSDADKAKADAERGDFTLTGSDRAADVGAAGGQRGMFDEAAAPASDGFGEKFTLTLNDLFQNVPYRASAPVPLATGESVVSTEIVPRKTVISKADQEAYDLPATVLAWRVSAIKHANGEFSARIEPMVKDYGRAPGGEVVAYFQDARGVADAIDRIAPSVSKIAIQAYETAKGAAGGQTPMFSRAPAAKADKAAAKAAAVKKSRDEAFAKWSDNAPMVTSAQAGSYTFKTGEKVVVEAYHGSQRPDRIGGVFDPKRATSGPMAYFTSSPELASTYAKGKSDTSLADEDQQYANWFKVKVPGQRSEVDIARAWSSLTPEQKAAIEKRMPDIRQDEDGNVVYEEGGGDPGSYEWELQQTQRGYDRRGNPLKAAVETWLTSGTLFDQELDFMKVLQLAGFPVKDVRPDFPTDQFPGVFKTFVAMKKPLVVSDIPAEVDAALAEAARRDRGRVQPQGADTWDKRARTVRDWYEQYKGLDSRAPAYAWTSIPDKVTDVFKAFGYDGIIDWSGKGGGHQHPVYIPFGPTQVKSAFNRGTFDPNKKDINFSRTPARKASDANLVATQQLVDGLKANWTNAPEIIVARNMQDTQIPQSVRDYDQTLKSQGATGEARGFIYQGKVYLLADQLNGPHQIAEVLFHEVLGHYGLRRAFGKGLTPILQQVATMRRKEMQAKAKEYGLDLTNERDRLTAAEEILAEMAQATPEIGFVKRAIAVIRNWMRANVPGFQSLRLTDNDIIQAYILPARGAVTRSKETGLQSIERAMGAFSRGTNKAVTNPNDVVGNQGGRSADDVTKGVRTAASQIVEAMAADEDADYALRVLQEDVPAVKTGDTLPLSRRWDDGNATDEELSGTSGAEIKASNEMAVQAAIRSLGAHRTGNNGYYPGTRIVLIKGERSAVGDDPGEVLLRNAEVVASWNKAGEDAHPIIPNESPASNRTDAPVFSRANGTSAWDAPEPSRFDNLAYKVQDKHIDTKRVVESITKTVGQIKDSLNVYLQEELYHGRAARRVADFGGSELKPMLNQMRMAGLSLDDVEEYLHARHAKEANALIASREPGMPDGGSGMTNKAADDYMRNLPADQKRKLEAVAAKVDAITASTRQLYADYGLEDQKTVDGWGTMFANYVPLMREGKDGGMGIGQGFTVKGKEVKGRTGSTRKVVDILANIAAQREKVIVRGEKNRVATALVGLAAANPNPEFWEARSQPPTERVYDAKTDSVIDRPDSMFKQRANVVTAKVKDAQGNVTEQAVVFNEDDPRAMRMAAALKNLDAANLEGLLGVSAKITRYFSAMNTQWNPVFGVVNLVRDVQGAMVNLAATPLAGQQRKIAKDTMSALASIYQDVRAERSGKQATSKWSKLWAQMQEDGGTTGYRDLFATTADRANSLKSIINPEAWADSPWGKVFTANGTLKVPLTMAKQKAGVLFDWLSDYNDAMENGVRLAVYKAALDKGMSREQAASMAKNLTVNFNRKGQIGQQAGALYAFFNAAMQGTARIGQTLFDMDGGNVKTLRLSKTGKAVVYGGVTLGAIQALMLAGAGFDDEDPPEFVRERSLIIPTGGKTYVSIPMPLGLHVIPGIGRHATEFALSGFEKPAKRVVSMLGMLADAFNPIGNSGLSIQTIAPTVIDPLVALTENRDWTGKPIARVSSNKAIPGHSQWKDTATGLSKAIAEAVNWISGGDEYVAGAFSPTPDQIDYLIAQVTGGVGREISKVEQAGKAALSGEELPTYKTPLLGRFYGNAEGQASEGAAFYANVDKLNEIETKVKAMRKDGKMAEASEYLRSKPEAVLIFQVNAAERRIQQLKRDKRELIEQDASREQVRAKEVQITEVMARLNRAAEAKSL